MAYTVTSLVNNKDYYLHFNGKVHYFCADIRENSVDTIPSNYNIFFQVNGLPFLSNKKGLQDS